MTLALMRICSSPFQEGRWLGVSRYPYGLACEGSLDCGTAPSTSSINRFRQDSLSHPRAEGRHVDSRHVSGLFPRYGEGPIVVGCLCSRPQRDAIRLDL